MLSDVGQSFAFEEQLLQIGCAIVVIATNLRGFSRVQTQLLECFTIERRGVVDFVESLHKLFVILVTGETG